jgi:3,4-dihydroxyphenylacetate 2,3-dioxygenase
MGQIVGAAIVSHHPTIMRSQADRLKLGAGSDTDLIPGFGRIRQKIDALNADTFVIFDTHWITTNIHLVGGLEHYKGIYTSDELPHVLAGVAYDYPGAPDLAARVEAIGKQRGAPVFNVTDPNMANHYATLNVLGHLHRGEGVMSVGACQNASMENFLEFGAIIGQAIAESDRRVMLLASGALSHAFTSIDHKPKHPSFFNPANVFSDENVRLDHEVLGLFAKGDHAAALDRYPEMRKARYEGFGSHYVQMIGVLGGRDCQAIGTPMSEYENARGTGNIHVWFDVPQDRQRAA